MKSYVIIFCILVYCSKIVESNPLSEEIIVQSSSKSNNLPANNAHRLYENADIARPQHVNPYNGYRQPDGQEYIQQRHSNGNYRPYNQFKGRQPGKFIHRNVHNNKNWVYPNERVEAEAPPPKVLATLNENTLLNTAAEAYISHVPVQNQRPWINNVEYVPPVKPHYYQELKHRNPTPVFQKPAVHGPRIIQPEIIVPAKNQPVDISAPKITIVQEPANYNIPTNLQTLINSDQVLNVLATNAKSRGFLIVHPNGTIEQMDEISEIHKSHPNYFIMNVGDVIPNQSPVKVFSTVPGPLSNLPFNPAPVDATPSPPIAPNDIASSQAIPIPLSNDVPSPIKPYVHPQPNNPNNKPYNRPANAPTGGFYIPPPYTPNKNWPGYKAKDVDNARLTGFNFYTTSSPILPLLNQDASPIQNIAITPSPGDAITTPKGNELTEPEIDDDEPIIESIEDAPITNPDDSDNDSTTVEVPNSTTIAPGTPAEDSTIPSDDVTTVAPEDVDKADAASLVTQSDQDLSSIMDAIESDLTTPTPTPTPTDSIPETYNLTIDISKSVDITISDDDDDDDDDDGSEDDDDDEIITLSPIENPNYDLSNGPDGSVAITIKPKSDTDSKTTVYETSTITNENGIVKVPCPNVINEVPAETENLKTTSKPVVWFKTTNAEFWDKLMKSNDYDVIYFMQMQPQPIIHKDSKTIVFPNGTTYEEITVTKWVGKEDPEPKVAKSIKITHQEQ